MPDPVEEEVVAHLARMRNDIFPYGEWLMKCWLDYVLKMMIFRTTPDRNG